MTFRIDAVDLMPDGRWRFGIKGYQGQGVYCRLWTNSRGHGLEAFHGMMIDDAGQGEDILDADGFYVPQDADPDVARACLRRALHTLGWGSEVDQRSRIVSFSS